MSAPALLSRPGFGFEAPPGALPLGGLFGGLTLLACAAVGLLGLDHLGVSLCVFRLATGLPCPTCGSTRALGRLAHLDLTGALAMNPLAAAGAIALLAWGVVDLALLTRGRALRLRVPPAWQGPLRAGVLTVLLLNWVLLLLVRR
jgi:hypothetical protein